LENTLGYIKRLADKKYRIIYDAPLRNGKRRQKTETLVGVTKAQAESVLAERKRAVIGGDFIADAAMTVNELFDRFMTAKSRKCAPTTLQRYDSLMRTYLRPAFGTVTLAKLKTVHLVSAYATWSEKGTSAATLLHAHDLMRNTLNRAVKWDVVPRSVADSIDTDDLPKAAKPTSVVLNEGELRRLLEEARSPSHRSRSRGYLSAYGAFYPAIAFAAYTGARRGEVLALRWNEVDFTAGAATISRSLSETKSGLIFKEPKNGKSRTISISGALVSLLRTHRATQAAEKLAMGSGYHDQGLAFARPDGSPIPPWNFGSAFRDLVVRAGVTRIRLHDLRDTHASLLAKAGVPIEVVSKRLGHSTIAITVDRYLVVYRERDEAAALAFEALVG
jgi:integrase